ncbi:hypothetical protein L9F63_021558, partial [Diploptera punctata]
VHCCKKNGIRDWRTGFDQNYLLVIRNLFIYHITFKQNRHNMTFANCKKKKSTLKKVVTTVIHIVITMKSFFRGPVKCTRNSNNELLVLYS